jgi:membrane protease YdiL (CAAX protease family)
MENEHQKLTLAQSGGNHPRSAALLGPWGGVGAFFVAYVTSYLLYQICLVPLLINILDDEAKRSIAWNLSLLTIGVLICWIFPETPRNFGLHISFRNGSLAFLAGIASANVVAWLQTQVGYLEEFDHSLIKIMLIVLVSPILEEFFCRGIMLNALLTKNNVILAVLIESVLFGSAHESFWAGFSGQLLLCLVYLSFRRSIVVSCASHMALNCAAMFPNVFMPTFLRGVHH